MRKISIYHFDPLIYLIVFFGLAVRCTMYKKSLTFDISGWYSSNVLSTHKRGKKEKYFIESQLSEFTGLMNEMKRNENQ